MHEGASLPGVEKKTRSVGESARAAAEKAAGKLTLAEVLRHKVRYCIDGAAIGGGEFVEKGFAVNRTLFAAKRATGARSMRGTDWGPVKILSMTRCLLAEPHRRKTEICSNPSPSSPAPATHGQPIKTRDGRNAGYRF
jgi:hypothetical protein